MSPLAFVLAFFALNIALPHPHVPKAIVMQGAGGKATLTWFTVPYNKDQVATLKNGQEWHLGFANLDVGTPLAAGTTKIPKGTYKLNALRDDTGEFSTFVLVPVELLRAGGRRGQAADPEKLAAVKKELAEKGIPERIELPAAKWEDPAAEHLEFLTMTRGYEAVQRGSAEPKGGASFTLLATFGDLHRKVDLQEEFAAPASAGK